MPHRFRYDHEQALAIYTGQAKRNRLSGFETVGCTFYAHGAGVLLRAEAQGCKTKRRVRYRFSVVSLRAHTTRVRIALQDRLLPTPQPKPVEVEEPEVEEPDDPASDAWGRIEGDRCFGIPPAMPGYNCGADPTVTPEEEAPASEEEAPAPTP